jgi:hypothetical protein
MSTDLERKQPGARANLKIVVKPLAEIHAEAEVPASQSQRLLDIPVALSSVAGPALTLGVASYFGIPWWAASLLAVGQLIFTRVRRW